MAKQIRHVSDLPKWFNAAKYAAAESLDVAGWYEQLAVRHVLRTLMDSSWENWQEILEHIRIAPIVDVAGNEMMRIYFYGGAMHELKSQQPFYALGVHLSTFRDLYLAERNIERDKRDYARKFFAQLDGEVARPLKIPCTDWIDEPMDAFTTANGWGWVLNVRVNMTLPDKELIEQFKRLLKEQRAPLQSLGIPSECSRKPDVSGWHRFGVLPYLDLKIWEREANVRIPNRIMAKVIFPEGEGGDEVVRKTTAKLADELMTQKRLENLASIAAHEIAEQNAG